MGMAHTGALLTSGLVYMWGSNRYGQLGIGSTRIGNFAPTPAVFPTGTVVTVLAAGGYHTGAIGSDSSLYMWGYNNNGQLGNGGTTNQNQPVYIGTGYTALVLGSDHSCGLKVNVGVNAMYCWGDNSNCAVGKPVLKSSRRVLTTSPVTTPYLVTLTSAVSAMALGNGFTAVLEGNGNVLTWGSNNVGQLGQGTTDSNPHCPASSSPVTFPVTVIQVSAGYYFMCALVQGGTVYCWGSNSQAQLGDGKAGYHLSSPQLVPILSPISVISAGAAQVYAVSTGGTVYEWGGQGVCEGLSTTTFTSPTPLTALTNEALLAQGSQAQGGCIAVNL